ncbi:hypothetical protein RF11_12043 [Thelohanellus kitauei]|uniref:Uncharacterized protein n=1 Tax=Thelohanellus kitauei TaxID=669202 RepID=A0A0C2JHJ0_THEKT|nr:hypothetical protein RF11_12043 [Thelohanellus kitauei]
MIHQQILTIIIESFPLFPQIKFMNLIHPIITVDLDSKQTMIKSIHIIPSDLEKLQFMLQTDNVEFIHPQIQCADLEALLILVQVIQVKVILFHIRPADLTALQTIIEIIQVKSIHYQIRPIDLDTLLKVVQIIHMDEINHQIRTAPLDSLQIMTQIPHLMMGIMRKLKSLFPSTNDMITSLVLVALPVLLMIFLIAHTCKKSNNHQNADVL